MVKNLSTENRDYFQLARRGVLVNPFSPERQEIYRELSGHNEIAEINDMVPAITRELGKRIGQLDSRSIATISDFAEHDRDLVRYVFLFNIYNHYFEQFDASIDQKNGDPDSSNQVPFAEDVLKLIIQRGLNKKEACRYFSLFYQLRRAFYFIEHGLVGQSHCLRQLRMNLWNNIFTYDTQLYDRYLWGKMKDFSTLLLGPTGAGKGAAAAAIGRSGYIPFDPVKMQFKASFNQTFVPINLSQYPETLLESELFGHTKGAFTGATGSHEGLFARCSEHGSIFLDEIGEVSVQVQIKLLQVLEERIFSPVGSYEKLRFNGRVIAATNQSIDELRSRGEFRDDFFYRLCSDVIVVPSLRQRIAECPGELDEMVAHTVARITGQSSEELTDVVLQMIRKQLGPDYPWPGNVRELAQCVRRILLKRSYEGDFSVENSDHKNDLLASLQAGTLDAQSLLGGYCRLLYDQTGSYEAVARTTKLDRRTVKKYIESIKNIVS